MPLLKWDTQKDAMHSVRVLCDELKLNWEQKAIICSCIWQESNFLNYRKPGVPMQGFNKDPKTGKVLSTDWGICQVNDYWNIGPKKVWPSKEFVVQNPEKMVRWMIQCYKQGRLNLWSSYKFGAYKQWMPYFMVRDKWLQLLKK